MAIPLRIKICGVTRVEDLQIADEAGADAVGINFYPKSPRYVDPGQAIDLVRDISPWMSALGVFVGEPMQTMAAVAVRVGLRGVQAHGSLEPGEVPPLPLIAAFRIRDRHSLDEARAYLERCRERSWLPAAVLADAFVEGQEGGTGQTAPWQLLADFRPGVPLILAGGLTPENVAAAVEIVRPAAVDVASGVESAPGRKDAAKVRQFIANARAAAARL